MQGKIFAVRMAEQLSPIYEKRQEILKRPGIIKEVVEQGNRNARKVAEKNHA